MIILKELHTDDLSMNSGKLFREQMVENFKIIEQTLAEITLSNEKVQKLQKVLELSDDDLNNL